MAVDDALKKIELLIESLNAQAGATIQPIPAQKFAPPNARTIEETLDQIRHLPDSVGKATDETFTSLDDHKQLIKRKNLTYDQLLDLAATLTAEIELLEFENSCQSNLLETNEKIIDLQSAALAEYQASQTVLTEGMASHLAVSNTRNRFEGAIAGREAQVKIMARKGGEAKNSKPGGSRDKQEQIRRAWATGKYTSRDICAEQECGAIGMSFSSARKALRNTPDVSLSATSGIGNAQ